MRYREELTRTQQAALDHAALSLADAHGRFTAEVRRWAEAVNASPTTVKAAIAIAVECGLLEREPFFGENGRQRGSEYRLTIVPDARPGRPPKAAEMRVRKVVAFATHPLKNVRTLGTAGTKSTSAATRKQAGTGPPLRKRVVSVDEKVARVESGLRDVCRVVRPKNRPGSAAAWSVSCPLPGHVDRCPSALVEVTLDGQVRFACFACGSGRDAGYWREAAEAIGLPFGWCFADWWEVER